MTLNLGLRRKLDWEFVVADVCKPILGADFLQYYGLMVDLQRKLLVDSKTNMKVHCATALQMPEPVFAVNADHPFRKLLEEFKDLTIPTSYNKSGAVRTTVQHHIVTTGQPVYARPRRLNPQRLQAAKSEFQHMLDQGICTP
ncbi:uncharacterized protein LOC119674050 [Teleopsis dalmanni]|uniref:uncharacterized protein LOC119674050 n=1 Tax=Teleopsis dalmanni TaxID=139649 RepID=UPI0018CF4908|nr:uncharacterized protein LOC119674050 [Teleopsis dalmanni]